jgi:hypothetical protein
MSLRCGDRPEASCPNFPEIQWTETRTQVFNLYAAAAKDGPVPADILVS